MDLRRILLAIAVTCGLGAGGAALNAAPAHAAPGAAPTTVTAADDDSDGDGDDDGDGDRDDRGESGSRGDDDRVPRGGVETGGGALQDDDDDDHPSGGVDTGAGGLTRDDDDDTPSGGVSTGQGGTARDDDDDTPRGGVETGAGGTSAQRSTTQAADPVRLRIPSIGLTTKIIGLRLDRSGKLIAPKRYDLTGWNVAGPEPGERGAAVIAGHVDSRTGPAVFHGLRDLKPGARIHVDRKDGSTVTFQVRRLAGYPKSRIPDTQVYGSTGRPELRLITCAGTFDQKRRSYRDNLVIFAS
ncbi:class F sortase [Nonomuraea dietziae]|uniref:Secreted protein n=1 Tax=Nonomuraea dietziae TaxID=65515 RepID=A0A7W5VFH8_9ACTN|nr:class F sortase [Nonomuraea dietziae]MBB3730699.1 hypothetical protein [Nonomuraea dietziae]